jgi:hypothetical protein
MWLAGCQRWPTSSLLFTHVKRTATTLGHSRREAEGRTRRLACPSRRLEAAHIGRRVASASDNANRWWRTSQQTFHFVFRGCLKRRPIRPDFTALAAKPTPACGKRRESALCRGISGNFKSMKKLERETGSAPATSFWAIELTQFSFSAPGGRLTVFKWCSVSRVQEPPLAIQM